MGKERRMVGDAWLKSAVEMGGILESCRCELALWSRKYAISIVILCIFCLILIQGRLCSMHFMRTCMRLCMHS